MPDIKNTAPDDDNDGAELVGSGNFTLDRAHALEKLMRFQLPHPGMYALVLIRCAAAGGASQIFITHCEKGRKIALRFDGQAFSPAELAAPYACLFENRTPQTTRNRELAMALLSILRLKPDAISVRSGRGRNRTLLRVRGLKSHKAEPATDKETETVIEAVQSPGAEKTLWTADIAGMLKDRCRMSPLPIYRNGKLLPVFRPEESGREGLLFDVDGVRGFLAVPEKPAADSELFAHRLGVFAETLHETLPTVQVQGHINEDRLRLNTSQTGMVRNKRLDTTLSVIAAQAEKLARQAIERHDESLEAAAPKARRAFFEGNGAAPARVRWLRRSARALLSSYKKDKNSPLRKALWRSRLFLGADARPLSLWDIARTRRRLGSVPYSATSFPDLQAASGVLWAFSPAELDDAALWFKKQLADVRPALKMAARRGAFDEPDPFAGSLPKDPEWRDPAEEMRRCLKALKRRDQCPLSEETIDAMRLTSQADGALVGRTPDRGWALNTAHPLVREVETQAGPAPRARVPYLISLFVTGMNRLFPEITDEEDARFGLSLAEFVLEADADIRPHLKKDDEKNAER